MSRFEDRLCTVILVGAVAAFGASCAVRAALDPVPWWKDNDFAHYYVTASAALEGRDPYLLDDVLEREHAAGFTPSAPLRQLTNPPGLVSMTLPLPFFPPRIAFMLWTLVQAAGLFLMCASLARSAPIRMTKFASIMAGAAVVFSAPFYSHVKTGQTQLLVGGLTLFGAMLLQSHRRFIGGAVIGLSVSLKLFTWPLVFLCWRFGGLRGVSGFFSGFLLGCAPFFSFAGWEPVRTFIERAPRFIQASAFHFTGNISILAALQTTAELCGVDLRNSGVPLQWGIFFVLAGISFRIYRGGGGSSVRMAALLLFASTVMAPTVWPHYLVLSVPVIWHLFADLEGRVFPERRLAERRLAERRLLLTILAVSLGATIGVIPGASPVATFVSSWWGSVLGGVLLYLLWGDAGRSGCGGRFDKMPII